MSEDSNKPFVPKTAMDFQKLKLERLMANPDKPVVIPEMPKERKGFTVPEFVRNVMGSSAGAGSGEFHVYRHLRRKEYTRQKMIEEKGEQERLDEEFQKKLEENKRKMDERTEKKRAKRLRKKAKLKEKLKGGKKQSTSRAKQDSSSEESDSQSEAEESESKEQAESSETHNPSKDPESSIVCDSSKNPEDSENSDHAKEMHKSNMDSPENVESSET